jgi:D-tyrosyl-tRNA(Tyr) deacylase
MPKHAVEYASRDMVLQMIEKTTPKPDFAVLDWKGMRGDERRKVIGILSDLNIPWKKTSELKSL